MCGLWKLSREITISALLVALVARFATAQVRVTNAQGDSLVIRCPVESCRPRIWLSQSDTSATLVCIRVDSLQRPDFTLLPLRWSVVGRAPGADTVTLPPGDGVAIAVDATLSERGRYDAAIDVIYGKKSTYTRIVFLRAQESQSMVVSGPGSVATTTRTVRLCLQARDSVGRARRIESMSFDSLTRAWGGKRVQAQYTALNFGADRECVKRDTAVIS